MIQIGFSATQIRPCFCDESQPGKQSSRWDQWIRSAEEWNDKSFGEQICQVTGERLKTLWACETSIPRLEDIKQVTLSLHAEVDHYSMQQSCWVSTPNARTTVKTGRTMKIATLQRTGWRRQLQMTQTCRTTIGPEEVTGVLNNAVWYIKLRVHHSVW